MSRPPAMLTSDENGGLLEAHRLFHDLPFIGMAVAAADTGHWVHVNTALCDMLGYSREALIEKSWRELTHPDDLDADMTEFSRLRQGLITGYKLDKRFIRADGTTVYASIDVRSVQGGSGVTDVYVATVYDISARVEAERVARESAALLEKLGRQVPGMIYQFLLEPGRVMSFPYVSEAVREVFEVEPAVARARAQAVFERIHPDDLPRVRETVDASAATLQPWRCEFRAMLPMRGQRWLRADSRPEQIAEGTVLWHGYITDITERHLEREALLRLEAAITSSINGVGIADLDGTLRYVNPVLLEMWGYTSQEAVLGRQVSEFWSTPAVLSDVFGTLERTGAWRGELMALHADGSERVMEVNASLFPDERGAPAGMLASFADITEQRRTEDALHVRDEAIRTAITAIAIGDKSGKPVYVNPAFVRLWGYEGEEEILGLEMADLLATGEAVPQAKLGTLFTNGAWQGELKARRRDGSLFDMLATTNVVRDASGEIMHLMGSFVDITESKRLQAEVLQVQKMESVGRLAGGVAHDFNNLLTVMKGCLGLALDSLDDASPIRNELLEINRAADSAAELTRQLLAFSRKQIIAPRILDLNDVVHRVHGMLLRLLGADIRLGVVTVPGLGTVRFDPGQAEQILVNLAVNARDAMPHGGTLTVETSMAVLTPAQVRGTPGLEAGEFVVLTVSDTGVGMSEETRAHVFEPFFTTKEIGQGTGLGLAMIHGAVSQNGGRVDVASEVGRGTTFRIYLPRVSQPAVAVSEPAAATAIPRGSETLVLVEDEAAVRELMRRLLQRQGYEVIAFASGAAVLEWLAAPEARIDLLVTDVIMPGMNGQVLADRVRALRPELRVLFASGYTADVVLPQGRRLRGVDFIPKPFTAASLATAVRELLDRTS